MFANSADAANLDDLTVRVDGVQVANSNSLNLVGSLVTLDIGAATVSGSGDVFYIDDVAVNNTTGGSQASWPGIGKIVAARPNAAHWATIARPARRDDHCVRSARAASGLPGGTAARHRKSVDCGPR